jgi:hypothetical protein
VGGAVDAASRPNGQDWNMSISRYWCFPIDDSLLHDPNRHFDVRSLVFRPIMPQFLLNTIFYAAMLWLLFASFWLPGKIRRFIRIRGHRCPACGYQIAPGGGIGPVCSECGAALPAAWSTNAS